MTTEASFDDIFAAMSAAAYGKPTARVPIPEHPDVDDLSTRVALALNILLDDLASRQRGLERMADRERVLAEAARDFSAATQDHQRLLDSVAKRVAAVLRDCCVVLLASTDGRALELAALHAPDDDGLRHSRAMFSEPLLLEQHPVARRVHETGEPFFAPTLDLEELRARTTPTYIAAAEALGMHSLLIVPLRVLDRSFGQLVLMRGSATSAPFDKDDLNLARALAEHASLAIANARSYAAEQAARERYRSMFDDNPQPMFLVDSGTFAFIEANASAVKHYGYTRAEFAKMTVVDLWPIEDMARNLAELPGPLSPDHSASGAHRKKDGSICDVEIRAHALSIDGRARRLLLVNDVTARRRAERARTSAETRFARLADSGILGILVIRLEGRVVLEVNEALANILGYSREEILSGAVAWGNVTPPEWQAGDRAAADQLIATGVAELREKAYIGKDGARVPVLVGAAMLEGSDTECISFVLDLRESKIADERKAAVVDAALDAVVGMNHAGAITEFNPAAERTFGYSRAEVMGRVLAEVIVPPRMRADHARGLQRFLATGEGPVIGKRIELSAVRRDGAEFPMELSISRVGSGKTPTFVRFIRDISERKRVERVFVERMRVAALGADVGMALSTGETLGATLHRCCEGIVRNLDTTVARIWTLNTKTRVLELQASAGLHVRIDEAQAKIPIGSLLIGRIAEDRRPYVSNDVTNDPQVSDPEWAHREGLTSFAGHPLVADGNVVGVMAIFARDAFSDVALAGLAAIADAIALRVRGRLAEQEKAALEEQLRQAQKMEAVGRLAGGIAHDFNNVLSVVLSYAELIISDLSPGDPVRADVEEIHRAGERAAALTLQLLMFSRQQVIAPKVLDLNELLAGMDKMLRRVVGESVVLTCVAGTSLGHVRVDPGSIEQVVMNLVVNARDAMPTGGKLTLETANVVLDESYANTHIGAKAGAYIMLSVTDTGTGIDKATLARIFDPFFTTKALGKGTGLGLSTVFGIMQQSGGNVWVHSEPGLRTTFKAYLPRVDAPAEVLHPQHASAHLRGSETILLVEDEQQVRDVARGILRRHGYTVIEAANAGEALLRSEAHEGTIHLLLSDVVMPGMSGPALVAERLASVRPEMKVLCMSGYTDDAAVRHGVMDAALAYLQKPFSVEMLTRRVRDVLDANAN